jgi:hypothetical protein
MNNPSLFDAIDPRDFIGFKVRSLAEPIPKGGSFIKPDEGARRRDVGHASALSHVFVDEIRRAVLHVARTRQSFVSEDVIAELSPATAEALAAYPNVMGAVFRGEAKGGNIAQTGEYRAATRPEARKRRLAVWRKSGG